MMCELSLSDALVLTIAVCSFCLGSWTLWTFWPRKPKPPKPPRTFTYQERDECTGMMITKTREIPPMPYTPMC